MSRLILEIFIFLIILFFAFIFLLILSEIARSCHPSYVIEVMLNPRLKIYILDSRRSQFILLYIRCLILGISPTTLYAQWVKRKDTAASIEMICLRPKLRAGSALHDFCWLNFQPLILLLFEKWPELLFCKLIFGRLLSNKI